MNLLNLSAKYNNIEPDSKILIGCFSDLSNKLGIFEFGLISTKPEPN